jgi:hypothetical protein
MKSYVLKEIFFPISNPKLGEPVTVVITDNLRRILAVIDLLIRPDATREEAINKRYMRTVQDGATTYGVLDWTRVSHLDSIDGFKFTLSSLERGSVNGVWAGDKPFTEVGTSVDITNRTMALANIKTEALAIAGCTGVSAAIDYTVVKVKELIRSDVIQAIDQ